MTGGPTVLLALPRELVEQLAPGAIRDAERLAGGFLDERERASWMAGHIGARVLAALAAKR